MLNESNNDAFERHIVRDSPMEDIERELALPNRYDPNRRLLEAALSCREHVSNNNGSEPITLDNNSLALIDSAGRESKTEAGYLRYAPKTERYSWIE